MVALCTITKYSLIGEWVNKLQLIHVMKSYLAMKRNKLPIYAITWLNFKCITIRERNLTQKAINYDFVYMTFWKRHTYRDREQISDCQGDGEGLSTKEHVGNFEGDETVPCLDCGSDYMTVYICQTHRSMHKKGELIPQQARLLIKYVVYCPSECPSYIFVNVTYVLKRPSNSYLLLSKWPPDSKSLLKGWA